MKIVFTICVVLGLFFACPFALGAPSTLTLVCCDTLPESSGRTLHIDFAANTVNGHPPAKVSQYSTCAPTGGGSRQYLCSARCLVDRSLATRTADRSEPDGCMARLMDASIHFVHPP